MYNDNDNGFLWSIVLGVFFLLSFVALFSGLMNKDSTEKPEKPFIVVGKDDRQHRGDFINYEYRYIDKNGNRYTFIDSKKYSIGDTLGK